MAGRSRQDGRSGRVPLGGGTRPLSQPFASLAGLAASLPPGPSSTPASPAGDPALALRSGPAASKPTDPVTRAKKIVVRRERKGHGGKTTTRVEGLVGTSAELEALAKEWKRALGCGAVVEDVDILVQGEQSVRLVALLEARGARKVVLGN